MSRPNTAILPSVMPLSNSLQPSTSIASVKQSRMVSKTKGWSGISISPGMALSWQATCSGNTEASRSSERIRISGAGTLRPPECLSIANALVAFQRHRVPNKGA